ncbi:magnesium transporter CorA family protein [Weissella minor]|uniref:magnesium transporter CorA family protein n=1 Tax=Weissella minor TaxID=1620 RepID=UPI003AF2B6A2
MLKELFKGSQAKLYHAGNLAHAERENLHIPNAFIRDIEDENEAARWHFMEDENSVMLFLDAVVEDSDVPTKGAYHTESVSFLVQQSEQRVLLFTRPSMDFLADELVASVADFDADVTPMELLAEVLLVLYQDYETALNHLDSLRRDFQQMFYHKTRGFGGDLDAIWTVMNALLYIDSSLEDNSDVLKSLAKEFKVSKGTTAYRSVTNRLAIEAEQAHKMADLLSSVVNNISDSYSARNDRNLNWIMQILTVYSVVLTIPTIITGFYGQNVKYLPFAMQNNGWLITIIMTAILMAIATYWFWRHGYFDK